MFVGKMVCWTIMPIVCEIREEAGKLQKRQEYDVSSLPIHSHAPFTSFAQRASDNNSMKELESRQEALFQQCESSYHCWKFVHLF